MYRKCLHRSAKYPIHSDSVSEELIFPFGDVFLYEYTFLLNATETKNGMKNQNLCLPEMFVTIRAACGMNTTVFDTAREKYMLSSWYYFWLTPC